jgi:isopentenyl-diphosphate delta-isomerase
MSKQVILVDKQDKPIGLMPKLEAHEKGLLHRAFSIFVFNSRGEMLLQKRASGKYHTPGLWTNACCSHQIDGEDEQKGLSRRLKEEMGLEVNTFHKAFQFIYKAELDNGLTEHELDHVYFATSEDIPSPNPDEVSEWKYAFPIDIKKDMGQSPQLYTPWFKLLLDPVLDNIKSRQDIFNK